MKENTGFPQHTNHCPLLTSSLSKNIWINGKMILLSIKISYTLAHLITKWQNIWSVKQKHYPPIRLGDIYLTIFLLPIQLMNWLVNKCGQCWTFNCFGNRETFNGSEISLRNVQKFFRTKQVLQNHLRFHNEYIALVGGFSWEKHGDEKSFSSHTYFIVFYCIFWFYCKFWFYSQQLDHLWS